MNDKEKIFNCGIVTIIADYGFNYKCHKIYTGEHNQVSLNDCLNLFKDCHLMTVLYEEYTSGTVYKWGNHGKKWEKVGRTIGFA